MNLFKYHETKVVHSIFQNISSNLDTQSYPQSFNHNLLIRTLIWEGCKVKIEKSSHYCSKKGKRERDKLAFIETNLDFNPFPKDPFSAKLPVIEKINSVRSYWNTRRETNI